MVLWWPLFLVGSSHAAFVIPADTGQPLRCAGVPISIPADAADLSSLLRAAGRCDLSESAELGREGMAKLLAIGQARSGPLAFSLLTKAAESGDALSMHAIGVVTALGYALSLLACSVGARRYDPPAQLGRRQDGAGRRTGGVGRVGDVCQGVGLPTMPPVRRALPPCRRRRRTGTRDMDARNIATCETH